MSEVPPALLEPFDPARVREFRKVLERWYLRAGRSLPWRETADPYRIWISEIMLQQTTVKAVVPYYERFLARFPTVQSLAVASEEEVLKYWEGLGYYSRGRNLRRAAQQICEVHAGCFPQDLEELQSLPGVGRYTAGAIRSFGFNLPAPIVEANTLRLYSRLLGFRGDPRGQEGQKLLWSFAEQLQPKRSAGHLNQALMELGATVCTPSAPRCDSCAVNRFCTAFQQGEQERIPTPKVRPAVTQVVEATVAVQRGDRWLVRQREQEERWAGMWDFPRFSLEAVPPGGAITVLEEAAGQREALQKIQEQCGWSVNPLREVMQIRHTVTRYRIRLICYRSNVAETFPLPKTAGTFRWLTFPELQTLPMPMTGRRFVNRLLKDQ